MKTYHLTIEGNEFIVEVGDLTSSPVTVIVNGQPVSVGWEELSTAGAPARPVAPPPSPAAPTVIRPAAPPTVGAAGRSPLAGASGAQAQAAPMPGKILAVRVKPGDPVSYGQELAVLEAMKMEQSIRAGQDGIIASVNVAPGDSVAAGQVMFTFHK